MSKAKAKTKAKKLTPKQAAVKASSLLKGIDNSVAVINKHHGIIKENTVQLRNVVTGLSNAAVQETPKPKAPAKPKPAKAEKAKAKAPAKAKAAKAKAAKAKAAKKEAKAKPAKKGEKPKAEESAKASAKMKPPVDGRPTVKDATREEIAANGPDTKANLYHKVTDKYGYWSRQSFYNALKDKKSFRTVDGKIQVIGTPGAKTTDEEASRFVESVRKDQAVASTA